MLDDIADNLGHLFVVSSCMPRHNIEDQKPGSGCRFPSRELPINAIYCDALWEFHTNMFFHFCSCHFVTFQAQELVVESLLLTFPFVFTIL